MDRIVVIGGGASGILAGIYAKNNDNEVIILEKNSKPLKKLLITGNGKCNYFNDDFNIKHYSSNNLEILEKIINEENKKGILNFFDSIGIVPRIKNGYYYPASNQAYSIYNALLKESEIKGVKLKTDSKVISIKKEEKFIITLENEVIECDKLVISTGSKAYPKTGSEGDGYIFATKLSHSVNKIYPALVALISNNKVLKELDGVRTNVKVTLSKDNKVLKSEIGEIQFTKDSLSGICIYNLSIMLFEEINNNICININFLNEFNINTKEDFISEFDNKIKIVKNRNITELLEGYLNYKIVNVILKECNIKSDKKYEELTLEEKNILATKLIDYKFKIEGTKDYNSSQVCGGGISLEEINIESFESKKIKNLYFVGEILDVCGECGGYNLGFAFLSGMLAGKSVSND